MLRAYLDAAMARAEFESLADDGSVFGHIPGLDGVWANAPTVEECRDELESALEDWVIAGLRLGHEIPAVDGVSLALPEIAWPNSHVADIGPGLAKLLREAGVRPEEWEATP